jgi:hypothetical protein
MPSPAVEDYLKTIYKLSRNNEPATTSAIAERLSVAAGSVTGMLKRLAERDLLELSRAILTVARLHDGDGVGRGQYRPVSGPRMIGMTMGNDRPRPRHGRIDIGVDGSDMKVAIDQRHGVHCSRFLGTVERCPQLPPKR